MFDTMVTYLAITFIVGYVISIIFRLIFAHLNKKQSNKFLAEMEEKMKLLTIEAKKRSGDLQESMDMISKDHADMLTHLGEIEAGSQDKGDNTEESDVRNQGKDKGEKPGGS
mgnify:CR=1 FL=1